jgi:glycosyltransferase involved in cell wall biosynthesis
VSQNRLKVLHITKWFPNPDDPQLGIFVAKHIQSVSQECDIHVLHLCPRSVEKTEVEQIEVEGLPTTRISYPKEKSIFYKMCYLNSAISKTIEEIKKSFGNPDLIHAHLLAQPSLIARKHFAKTPIVVSEHWTGFVNGYFEKLPSFKRNIFRKSANRAHAVTVPSIGLKQAMTDHHFVANLQIVANVIETSSAEAHLPDDRLEILTVADMHDHNKNISGSLEAFTKVEWPFRFRIIGDGEDLAKLKLQAAKLNLVDRVVFEGRKTNPEVLEALSSCHCLLVNSRHETFSMVTAEALAAGVPVIATRCGGPETFVTPEAGILIDKDNPEQLRDALNRMNSSWQRFDKAAIKETFSTKFSREKIGQRFLEIYQAALIND